MEAKPLEIRVYRTREGRAPFKEWLKELPDREARARINVRLTRARGGNLGDVKAVGEGVSELRIDYGAGYRLYFAPAGELLILLPVRGRQTHAVEGQQTSAEFLARLQAEA